MEKRHNTKRSLILFQRTLTLDSKESVASNNAKCHINASSINKWGTESGWGRRR